MKLKIVSIGKANDWQQAGIGYYQKLLQGIDIQLLELNRPKTHINNNLSYSKDKEAELLRKHLGNFNVALTEHGRQFISTQFSEQLLLWNTTYGPINFFIGGPDGLSTSFLKMCQEKLSLSKFTMPHNLVKVVLLEQIFRAKSIADKHPYHRN